MKYIPPKTPERLAEERKEATDLKNKILARSATVPPKVMNSGSTTEIKRFKEIMANARAVAQAHRVDLEKLRKAARDVDFFYQ